MGKSKGYFLLISCFTATFFVIAKESPDYSLDLEYLPETSFSCKGKVHGAFYADVETECQMYHICSRNEDGVLEDNKFLCGNGTVFDQRRLVCQVARRVRCYNSPYHYRNAPALLKDLEERMVDSYHHQFLEAPSYSMEFLPETSFTCDEKVNGGYYADVETQCQMYHVCSKNKNGFLEDTKFLCGNGTVFDQKKLVCRDFRRIRCEDAPRFYRHGRLRQQPKERIDEYYQYPDAPSYSMEFLPKTGFSCKDKVNGGYYADVDAQCQLYHVCSRDKFGFLRDNKFLCGNGTVFDQKKLVCEDYLKVRCQDSPRFYRNVATILEQLEARRRSEADDRRLVAHANLELGRLS